MYLFSNFQLSLYSLKYGYENYLLILKLLHAYLANTNLLRAKKEK